MDSLAWHEDVVQAVGNAKTTLECTQHRTGHDHYGLDGAPVVDHGGLCASHHSVLPVSLTITNLASLTSLMVDPSVWSLPITVTSIDRPPWSS